MRKIIAEISKHDHDICLDGSMKAKDFQKIHLFLI